MTVDELVARRSVRMPRLAASCRGRRGHRPAPAGGLRPNPCLAWPASRTVSGPDNNVSVGVTVPWISQRAEGRAVGVVRAGAGDEARLSPRPSRAPLRADVRMKAGEALAAARNVQVTGELLELNRTALGLTQERVRTRRHPSAGGEPDAGRGQSLGCSRQVLESRLEVLRLQLKALTGLSPDAPLALRASWRTRTCRSTETSA